MRKDILVVFVFINFYHVMDAGFWGSALSNLEGDADVFKNFGEGMAQSFGMDPSGYSTSLRVFNNSEDTCAVKALRVKKYMNAAFDKGTIRYVGNIANGQDTGDQLNDIGLYLEVRWYANGNECLYDKIVSQEGQYYHCQNTYFSNFYSQVNGDKKSYGTAVEQLGFGKTTSDQFYGQFYNTLSEPCYLTYQFNGEKFTVLLEPFSFNFLQSDASTTGSMRPGNLLFTFPDGKTQTMALASYGLGTPAGKNEPTVPMQYHYEIIQLSNEQYHACNTGLGVGNYEQPVSGRVRTVSPVEIKIWNQSAAQAPATPGLMNIQSPTRTVWFAYGTPGWANISTGMSNVVIGTVPYGDVISFRVIRPTIDQYVTNDSLSTQLLSERETQIIEASIKASVAQLNHNGTDTSALGPVNIYYSVQGIVPQTTKAQLFIFSLDTADEKKARRFMEKIIDGTLQYDYDSQDVVMNALKNDINAMEAGILPSLTARDVASGSLKTDYAMVYDEGDTGVTGVPLIIDTFLSYGNGIGPYYYMIQPPAQNLNATSFSWLSSVLHNGSQLFPDTNGGNVPFSAVLSSWIQTVYNSQTVDEGLRNAYQEIVRFLRMYGLPSLFATSNSGAPLSYMGNKVLVSMLIGPSSIINQPLTWSQGISYFLVSGTSEPQGWKASSNAQNSTSTPANAITLPVLSPAQQVAPAQLNLGKRLS